MLKDDWCTESTFSYALCVDFVIEAGRRERKRQAVHDSLLAAAEELFRLQGIARTTVDDIVQAVDVARQTFFNHFPYKEALALELGAHSINQIAHRAHGLLEAGTPALDVLQQIAHWALDTATRQGELAVVVARELLHPDEERATRAARQMPLQDMFESVLIHARDEGDIREDLPLDVVAARLSAVVTCMYGQALSVGSEKLHQELAIFFDIVFNGITDRRS
ncbi:MAG: TetR/AcrR family transcriptional regulator [Chloroflexota bacterium]